MCLASHLRRLWKVDVQLGDASRRQLLPYDGVRITREDGEVRRGEAAHRRLRMDQARTVAPAESGYGRGGGGRE